LATRLIVGSLESTSKPVTWLEMNLPAAAQWFLFHASEMFRSEKKFHYENANEIYERKPSELWKGKKRWSKERWDFWKEKLEVMGKLEELSEETRDMCRRSIMRKGKAERAKK
jgi:hypothetical protein